MLVNQLDTEERKVSMLLLSGLLSACCTLRVEFCWSRFGSTLDAPLQCEMCERAVLKPAARE